MDGSEERDRATYAPGVDGPSEAGAGAGETAAAPPGLDPALPPPRPWRPGSGALRATAALYLAMLPLGHFITLPYQGTWVALSDVFLGLLLVVAAVTGLLHLAGALRGPGEHPLLPGFRVLHLAVLLLVLFAAWVAVGSAWGFHPGYARAKGLGFAALAGGIVAIAWSGASWKRLADAWLVGTVLSLAVVWLPLFLGPRWLQESVVYFGGAVEGLPFPRARGPFYHPNMFGDYLVISAAILWARWPAYAARSKLLPWAMAALMGLTLLLTASSALLGAGALLTVIGLTQVRQRGGRPTLAVRRVQPALLITAGLVMASGTFVALTTPVVLPGGEGVATNGIRPDIWRSAFEAVREAPVAGVGAAPFLARAADPVAGGDPVLWDAHNVYLSVWGQFGLVGVVLLFGGALLIVRELFRQGASQSHIALAAALIAVALHGLAIASEDFRHVWALLALAALATIPEPPEERVRRRTEARPLQEAAR